QGRARPVAQQQPGTAAAVLPIQLNPVHLINRHASAPFTLVDPTTRPPTLPSCQGPLIAHGGGSPTPRPPARGRPALPPGCRVTRCLARLRVVSRWQRNPAGTLDVRTA